MTTMPNPGHEGKSYAMNGNLDSTSSLDIGEHDSTSLQSRFSCLVEALKVQMIGFISKREQEHLQRAAILHSRVRSLASENIDLRHRLLSVCPKTMDVTVVEPVDSAIAIEDIDEETRNEFPSPKLMTNGTSIGQRRASGFEIKRPDEMVDMVHYSSIHSNAKISHDQYSLADICTLPLSGHNGVQSAHHTLGSKPTREMEILSPLAERHSSSGTVGVSFLGSSFETVAAAIMDANVYEVKPFWLEDHAVEPRPSHRTSFMDSQQTISFCRHNGTVPLSKGGSSAFERVANPLDRRRVLWELLGSLLIVFDLVMLPLQLVFEMPIPDVWIVGSWVIASYWALDIPVSFCTGFFVNGVLETRPKKMAKHYIRTWFLIDTVVVVCDFTYLILSVADPSGDNPVAKLGKALRLVRILRLVRLLKLNKFVQRRLERIHSEYILTLLHVTKVVVFIVVVNHFMACGWYGIGKYAPDVFDVADDETWIREAFASTDGMGYKYTTALHWSLTQFTPASMEVVPKNFIERTYNVFMLLFALVMFSSFLGTITEAMTNLRKINGKRDSQYALLRKYLHQNRVTTTTTTRIWRYLRKSFKAKTARSVWGDVEMLVTLPNILQVDLKREIFLPVLCWHPFLFQCRENMLVVCVAICHKAITEEQISNGQSLFDAGQEADRMYFVIDGSLHYFERDCNFIPRNHATVANGSWISEPAIWLRWSHLGSAIAPQNSAALVLQSQSLHKVLLFYRETLLAWKRFAQLFHEYAQRNGITDLRQDSHDFDKLQEMSQLAFEDLYAEVSRQSRRQSQDSAGVQAAGSHASTRSDQSFGGFVRLPWSNSLPLPDASATILAKFRHLFGTAVKRNSDLG